MHSGQQHWIEELSVRLTWNDVSSIHGILVLDEAEAIHQLHLSDVASAMFCEMGLNVGLGSCSMRKKRALVGAIAGARTEGYGPVRGRLPK